MKVFIKNKVLSLGGGSDVLNENKEPIFKVKGKIFSFTKKKKLYNMQGELLYTIRNKFWNIFSNKVYIKNSQGDRVATIKKNKWSWNKNYKILNTEDDLKIEGKFFSLESQIIKNEQLVATINRQFTIVTDAFSLEADEKDIAFYTAIVIALDNIVDKRSKD